MIITLKRGYDPADVQRALAARGLWVRRFDGAETATFLVEAHSSRLPADALRHVEGVATVAEPPSPHPLLDAQRSPVDVAGVLVGPGAPPVLMAGPCSVESEAQIEGLAASLSSSAAFLRGGAYKPRTSPYSFQGHGATALGWMRKAADRHGLRVVTEVMSPEDVAIVAEHADLLQVGSRNMQDYALLRAVGRANKPVLLKRGMAATVDEWLASAEHCLLHGARAILFCERGIRGFDASTRNVLDLGTVALLAHVHHLPVIVDPSHGTGRRDLVVPLSRAALAAGASGLMIETHPSPGEALSDGPQALLPDQLATLVAELDSKRSSTHGR